jgi:hypothetical protein
MKKILLPAFVAAAALVASASAQIIASDSAAAYTTPTWTNGSDLGTGFDAWSFVNSPGAGFAGNQIGSASALGTNAASLDTGGSAFSIFGGGGGSFDAYRKWSAALNTGDVFSTTLGFNFDDGFKGLTLLNGASEVFFFTISLGNYAWTGSASNAMTPYTPAQRENGVLINLSFTRTGTGFDFNLSSPQDPGLLGSGSVAASSLTEVKYFISGSGGGDKGNLYFNNLQVVPEPSTYTLLALSAAGLAAYAARRRARK